MHSLLRLLLCALTSVGLLGCAALIAGSGTAESEIIHAGSTASELTRRLGHPVHAATLPTPRRAWDLRENDPQISLLVYPSYGFDTDKGSYPIPPLDSAVSESVFKFSGRVGKDTRASQAGFDSFMTIGVAEVFLIPKALWERSREDDLQLTVWFDDGGRALAYKWAPLQKH